MNYNLQDKKIPFVIAGPCSAESEEQVLQTATQLKLNPLVKVFRAGVWKPRTRPNSFEGSGSKALPWLKRVKDEIGLPVATEVALPEHVEECLKYEIDFLWIGARTTTGPFAVQELANALKGTNVPVLVKNPINADISLWVGAIERLLDAGITNIMAIHRGFNSGLNSVYRNSPIWRIPLEFKQIFPDIPLLCDPSHLTGQSSLIGELCQKAMDMDMDGLMIETHLNPRHALSDAAQQITPHHLEDILLGLQLKKQFSSDIQFEKRLELLRDKIDIIDTDIIEYLRQRMEVVKQIAMAKKEVNITAFQKTRMDQLLKSRIKKAEDLGLSPEYIKDIFQFIHEESIKIQTNHFNSKNDLNLREETPVIH